MKGSHDGFNLAAHLQAVLARFGLDTRFLLGVTTDNASSNYSMTGCLQKLLENSAVEWNALQNHMPCMTHIIQLTLGAFMDSLGVKGRGKAWGETERDKIGLDAGMRRGRKIGGARVERVEQLEGGFNKIVEKVGNILFRERVALTNERRKQRLLAVVVNGSPKRRDDFLEMQKGNEPIAVTLILDVKTRWNSTLAMLERAYRLKSYTCWWLIEYPQYQGLFTTDDEWKAVEYVLQVLLPFRYWTLWMSKRKTITLHRVISIYNAMFDHMDSVLKALSKKKVQWKKDIHRAVRCARAKLRKYYSKVSPESGLILILASILDPFRKLRTFRSWDKEMAIASEDGDSYTTQYSNAFLAYWESNYVNISVGGQVNQNKMENEGGGSESTRNAEKRIPRIYGLDSSDEDDDLEVIGSSSTPRTTSRKTLLMQQARQYLANAPVIIESEQNDYPVGDELLSHDPEELTASFWYPDVAGWWLKQETTMGEYRDLARMARDIFSVMPHGVGVEASFSLGRDVISWRQSRTTGVTLQQKVVVRQWARSNNGILPEDIANQLLPSSSDDEQRKREDQRLDRLATLRDFLLFKKESDNLRSMQKKLKGKDVSVSGLGYISDQDDGREEDWHQFAHDGNQAFEKIGRENQTSGGRNITVGMVTKVCYGGLLRKVRRQRRMSGGLGADENADYDEALSEREAVWLLSDSEEEQSEIESGDAVSSEAKSDSEEEEIGNSEDGTPENGLQMPGFTRIVRHSTRLESRKRGGGGAARREARGR